MSLLYLIGFSSVEKRCTFHVHTKGGFALAVVAVAVGLTAGALVKVGRTTGTIHGSVRPMVLAIVHRLGRPKKVDGQPVGKVGAPVGCKPSVPPIRIVLICLALMV